VPRRFAGCATRLLFDRLDHLHEPADVVARDAAGDGALQIRQVIVHLPGDPPAFRGRRDHERPPIALADRAGDEAALLEAIENAGQRRAFVRQAAVEFGDRGRRRRRQHSKDVRLAL